VGLSEIEDLWSKRLLIQTQSSILKRSPERMWIRVRAA